MNKLNRAVSYSMSNHNTKLNIAGQQWNVQPTKMRKSNNAKSPTLMSIIYKKYPKQVKTLLASLILALIYFMGLSTAVDSVVQLVEFTQHTSTTQNNQQGHAQSQIISATSANKVTDTQNLTTNKKIASSAATQPNVSSINQYFKQKFRGGDWYYQGIEAVDDKLKVFIQIPSQMKLNNYETVNYIQLALCPNNHQARFFDRLKNKQLEIHLYSTLKANSVSALCKG